MRSFQACDAVYDDFCNDEIYARAVNASILFLVVNLSPEMDSATPICYMMGKIIATYFRYSLIMQQHIGGYRPIGSKQQLL